MGESIHRVIVDSRFKDRGGTNGNFSLKLSRGIHFGEETYAIVDDITISNTFYTISDANDSFYVAEHIGSSYVVRKCVASHGNKSGTTAVDAIVAALNVGTPVPLGTNPYSGVYTPDKGTSDITGSSVHGFCILSDDQIQNYEQMSGGIHIDKQNPRSGNGLLRNRSNNNLASNPSDYDYSVVFTSGYMDLLPCHNCFIHSNLADNGVMGCTGVGDCICIVPVSASYGQTIHHNANSASSQIDVSRRSFDTLTFQLKDAYGNILETNGTSWSCSISFVQKNI